MAAVSNSPMWALISGVMKQHGWSYRDVEVRSGGAITKGDLGFWRNGTTKTIVPAKMLALAKVLDRPLAEVVQAALATMNLDDGRVTTIEEAIARDDSLTELAKRRLMQVLREQRDLAAGGGDVAEAAYSPDEPPGPHDDSTP